MGSIHGALLMPDGRILSWSADKTLRLWDSDGNPLVTLKGHMGSIKGALLIHDGRILSWSGDKTLRLWDVGGKPLATLEGHTTQINGVLLMPNGRILSWSWDGTLRLWDIDGKPLATLLGHTIMLNGVLLTPDGRILSWSGDKTLRLWDVDGKPIATLEGHTGQVRGVLLTPDGRILSWSGDKTLRLWDSDGNCLGSLEGHTCESKGVLLIPDGQILSWADDGTIFLWSYDGEPLAIQVVQDIRGALLLSDGEILLWSDDRRVHLWDIHRNRFSVYSQIQSFNLFPEVRSKYFSEACICSRSIIDKKRCLLCLDVYGHDSIISICWNSLVYCKQKLLKHEGLVIATQENGQVCFLRTYNGDHRISLEEVEHSVTKTKELLLRDAISTLTSCGNEQNDKHETNLPVQYSQFNEKGTIAAIMEGRLTPDEGLRWAIRKGYKEIVSLALSKGADLCKEIGGSLPAEYARQKDKIDMIKALIPDSLPQDAALRFRFAEIQHFYHSARDNHDSRLKFCRDMESIALELQQKTGKIHKLLYAYNSMIVSSMVIDDFDLCAIYLDKSDLIDPEAQYGNHACLSARLGKTDEAFEWLAKYVAKKQEPDFEWMQKDPDLESIRTDPRWVSKLKAWNSQKTNDLVTATRANVISKIAELIYYSDLKDSERILWGAFLKKVNAEECIAVYDAVSASEENLYLLTKHLHSKIIEMRRNT